VLLNRKYLAEVVKSRSAHAFSTI